MIKQETISYLDQNVELEGYAVYHGKEKRPLVLLCHAWRGRDDFICEKTEQVAALGYSGFAIDMYGKGVIGKSKEENAALKKPFIDDRSFLQSRLLKGYETACTLPFVDASRIVVIGFGFGGLCALDLARSGVRLDGAVSIYGHFDPPQNFLPHPITAKILLLHGFRDPIVSMPDLLAFQQELDRQKVDWQSHVYGQACHAFATPSACDEASGILYDDASAKRAWLAVENFLREVL